MALSNCTVKHETFSKAPGRKCLKCGKKADITLPYGPQHFCAKHFMELTEKRVRKTVRKHRLIKAGEKIVVGVSGGKDSLTALYLLKKIFSNTNEFHALMIDEGIAGYRDKALAFAVKNCKSWGIPYSIVSYKQEFGISMDEVMNVLQKNPELGSSCAFCGVFRRRILNSFASKLGADRIATGHNLDDEVQSILMNIFDADLKRFARLGAKAGVREFDGFIPRIKPLYEIPEKELVAFASFAGIEHYSGKCCPYSWMAKRNDYRSFLNDFEKKYPGTKHSILRFFLEIKEQLPAPKKDAEGLSYCRECGELTGNTLCGPCSKIRMLEEKLALEKA